MLPGCFIVERGLRPRQVGPIQEGSTAAQAPLRPGSAISFPPVPQTLLAIFALACASYYAMTRQTLIVQDELRLVQNEVELVGASVAVDRLELISGESFDQNTIGDVTLTSPSQLTPVNQLGKASEAGDNDDIDDYNAAADTSTASPGAPPFGSGSTRPSPTAMRRALKRSPRRPPK